MIGLIFASILAGIIAGAPFGAAGALVADAALAQERKRLNLTILSAVSGDSILAFLVSFASSPVKAFLQEYEKIFFLIAGIVIIMLGFYLWKMVTFKGSHTLKAAGPVSVFFITLFHPGSIATFLFIVALFSMHFPVFKNHRLIFALGIAIGSFCVFSATGALFWILRKKAENFVHQFRYGLAAMLGLTGAYLLTKSFK